MSTDDTTPPDVENDAACACLTVRHDPIRHANGTRSDRWICESCGSTFTRTPARSTEAPPDVERAIRERAEQAARDALAEHLHLGEPHADLDPSERVVMDAAIDATLAAGLTAGREEVSRLRAVVKGVHGALADASTVAVPGRLDADLDDAVRALIAERDAAREAGRAEGMQKAASVCFKLALEAHGEDERLAVAFGEAIQRAADTPSKPED